MEDIDDRIASVCGKITQRVANVRHILGSFNERGSHQKGSRVRDTRTSIDGLSCQLFMGETLYFFYNI